MAPHHFPPNTSQPSLETWATGYGHDEAHVTQPRSFQFGCPGEESSDDFINITQWWYPEDDVAGWDGENSESQYSSSPPFESSNIVLPADGDPTTSASSSSTAPGGISHLWHGPTPPVCDVTSTGMYSGMYMGNSSWPQQFMPTGLETRTEFSWGDNAAFEPYVAPQQSESESSSFSPSNDI